MTDQLKMSDLGTHAYLMSWQEDRRKKMDTTKIRETMVTRETVVMIALRMCKKQN